MEYVRLGRTGLRVSELCFGTMSFGSSKWRPWVLEPAESEPFYQRAIDAGINFFDTADMYSGGASEEVTGRFLKQHGNRDELVIATKVFFPHGPGPNMGGLSRKHIEQACESSLRRLGVDTIDLYQIHRLDPHTPPEEMLAALDSLVQKGKVRYLGASSMYAWEFAQLLSISERNGWARMVAMQDHYNLLAREVEREMHPLCEYEGVGVIPWSPLARGHLAGTRKAVGDDSNQTTRGQTDGIDQQLYTADSDAAVLDAVRAVAERHERPMAQIALAWVSSKSAVTAPIIGVTKLAQLDDAIASLDVELSDDDIAELEAPYIPRHQAELGRPSLR
ncbi:MAG: aldo/keto reductase [Ilumatobacter sp.]|uniref:aldo/keto reductase n=1 Tax=Ilumatobacter sp. TaxID=1967498 RepID=UPI00329A55E1